MKQKGHIALQFNFCVAVTTILAGAPAIALECPVFDERWESISSQIVEKMKAEGTIGGGLYVIENGRITHKAEFGYADIATGERVDVDTIYHWASITKTFTSIAVMQLAERKMLSIDDSILDYLPELQNVHNPFDASAQPTLQHLMSHSAGFRAPTWPWDGDQDWMPYEPTEWSQLVAMMPYTKLHFSPGSRYGYSNLGTILLGQVVERITGDDIEVYIDKNILKPLGMNRSYFDHTPYFLLKHRSNNYILENGRPRANGLDFDTGITAANGGLNAPVNDFAKYIAFLAGAGDKSSYDIVLSRPTLHSMWKPRHTAYLGDSEFTEHIATGFFVIEYTPDNSAHRTFIGHTGSQKGFRSFFYIDVDSNVSVIWAINTSRPGLDSDDWDTGEPDSKKPADMTHDVRRTVLTELLPFAACH